MGTRSKSNYLLGLFVVGLAAFLGWLVTRSSRSIEPVGASRMNRSESVAKSTESLVGADLEPVAQEEADLSDRTPAQSATPQRSSLPARLSVEDAHARLEWLRARMLEHAATEGWQQVYAGFSASDLSREQDVVLRALRELVGEEFDRRFRTGDYEVVSTNGAYKSRHHNPYEVYQVRSLGSGLIGKCILPDVGFEEAYKLKAQCAWLGEVQASRP